MKYVRLALILILTFQLSPAHAVDACHTPASQRPDYCHTDDRVSRLSAEDRQNNIFFTRGGSKLDSDAVRQLQLLLAALNTQKMHGTCLRLTGHADSAGSDTANLRLSEARALAVKKFIEEAQQVNQMPIEVVALGEQTPMTGISPASAVQRRVAIWARHCAG